MNEITVKALLENMDVVIDFAENFLDSHDCPMKVKMQINIAIDEIFSNISQYAYGNDVGEATLRLELQDNPKEVIITFIDSGVPYNPLEKKDPDTTLSAEEREIGGLGIFMVKKNMDEMEYEYSDNKNILRMKKVM